MTILPWLQMALAAFGVIVSIWVFGKSRMADQLSKESAFTARDASAVAEMNAHKAADELAQTKRELRFQEEMRSAEKRIFDQLLESMRKASDDYKELHSQIGAIVQHKVDARVREVDREIEHLRESFGGLQKQIATMDERNREDFQELFRRLPKGAP